MTGVQTCALPIYSALPRQARRAVRTLASILRLAECLDRSHSQVVSAIEIVDEHDTLVLKVATSGDAELEIWAADRHVRPLAKIAGKPVVIASTRDAAPTVPPRKRVRRAPVNTDLTTRKPRRNRSTVASDR